MTQGVVLDWATLAPHSLDTTQLDALPVTWQRYDYTDASETRSRIADADIVLTNKVKLGADELADSRCGYIGVLATGLNNVAVDWCQQQGIQVANVAGYGTDAVAQHTLMLLLNLATRFADYHRDVQQGRWSGAPQFCLLDHQVVELAGKHAVIVGHGALGKRVEALYRALGMRVTIAARPGKTHDPRPALQSLLPETDVLSLHCQLSEDTHQLVNSDVLTALPAHAFIINTARGGLIDETALLQALQEQRIGGAALDVLSEEPPPANHILLTEEVANLLITPHSAWVAQAARQRLLDDAISQLACYLKS
ncbi:glycerate dehydrogenase [Alteromonas sp. ASW11-19]|uniref:Glycerate dehydrogenase n=1 Tax=Alteromonas salexigens TaxID=2982530 RepID=A0ABT2VJY1_9ALTE|nr:NAD(P)-dependent oxidoreductase [Alteromonas salexigens]MCU7553570.1 glycerate dehydrogenase [Alteromonas salexigens]